MRSTLITIFLGASLIGGCATKRETGAVVGAVGGGVVGHAVGGDVGLVVGAALGGLLGYKAGQAMEEHDRRHVAYALEANEPVTWENPRTGYYYEVEPTETYYRRGRECREFRMLAEVDRRPEEVWGTACRQPDGSWRVIGT